VTEERLGVLEVVALNRVGEHALTWNRRAIGGHCKRNLSRPDDNHEF
jgi:hypothetical protein